jgi:dTDP-4-amino-4,6-dideoxygalactose transaminase
VHCYGHPCDVDAIQKIADNYNLKVIYDAAHSFGVDCHCGSVLNHGDLSILSFHATKVYNTFEGGAIICPDAKTKTRIEHLKNFGFIDETTVVAPGINGKMSEINAAFGLLQLKHIDQAIAKRKAIDQLYRAELANIPGIYYFNNSHEIKHNYAYFPILVSDEYPISRDALFDLLKKNNINPRRYFYPLISEFSMYRGLPSAQSGNLPQANIASRQVLCLPIYPELEISIVEQICSIIKNANH